MRQRTTTQKINSALANNLLQIKRAEIYTKTAHKIEMINSEKISSFYVNLDVLWIVSGGRIAKTIKQMVT